MSLEPLVNNPFSRLGRIAGHVNHQLCPQRTKAVDNTAHQAYIRDRTILFKSLCQPDLLPRLNIQKCLDMAESSISRMLASPEAKAIKDLFNSTGLNCEVGYNQGTGLLNVIFPLPSRELLFKPISSPTQALIWAMLGIHHHQSAFEQDYAECARRNSFAGPFASDKPEHAPTTTFAARSGDSIFLRDALAVDEMVYDETITRLLKRDRPDPVLLANRCVHVFSHHTHAVMTSHRFDYELQTLSIVLRPSTRGVVQLPEGASGAPPPLVFLNQVAPITEEPIPDLSVAPAPEFNLDPLCATSFASPFILSDDDTEAFRYSPLYPLAVGYDTRQRFWSGALRAKQQDVLASRLLHHFWLHVRGELRYFPSDALVSQVNDVLWAHFHAGVSTLDARFSPEMELQVYLWGGAGTGKSTFVRVLLAALAHVVRGAFEPGKRFGVVRVPMNQVTVESLSALLMVKGISDWSVERIVEQTLCRGGVCILHLEEQPPNAELQDALTGLLRRMCGTLTSRYPEYRHNLMLLHTANYPPSPAIAKGAAVVEVTAPSPALQREWAARTLEDAIAANVVQLRLPAVPAASKDSVEVLRGLVQADPQPFYYSHPAPPPYLPSPLASSSVALPLAPVAVHAHSLFLRFLVGISIAAALPRTSDLRKLETWKRSVAFAALTHLYKHAPAVLHGADLPPHTIRARTLLSLAVNATIHDAASSPHRGIPQNTLLVSFTVVPRLPRAEPVALPVLTLTSADGFFFHAQSTAVTRAPAPVLGPFSSPMVPAHTLSAHVLARLHAVLHMWRASFLRPAVVVLAGTPAKTQATAHYLRHLLHTEFARPLSPSALTPGSTQRITCRDSPVPLNSNISVADAQDNAHNDMNPALAALLSARRDEDALVCPSIAAQAFFHLLPPAHARALAHTEAAIPAFSTACTCGQQCRAGEQAHKPLLREFFALARTERHQRMLLGDPDPATGALLRFLHDLSVADGNHYRRRGVDAVGASSAGVGAGAGAVGYADEELCAGAGGGACVGAVFAQCSGAGQFFLRDLIDAGDSLTHVTSVRKDRVLFVLLVDSTEEQRAADGDKGSDYHNIQPQLVSRAHNIVICDD